MKILFFILAGGLMAPALVRAQSKKPAAKTTAKSVPSKPGVAKAAPAKPRVAKPTAKAPATAGAMAKASSAEPADWAPARVALAPVTPAADPTALKIKAEVNPTTKQLAVRTDASGPTTIEVNDATGRPVLTRNVIAGNNSTDLNVSQLPAGYYVVRCTAGLRTGMRRVRLGE